LIDATKITPYLGVALAGILAILLVRNCNRADSAEAALKKANEAAKLTDAGTPPEAEGSAKDLKERLAQEESRSAAFKQSLEETTKTLNDLKAHPKIFEVVHWRTKPGAAGGKPLPEPAHDPVKPGVLVCAPCLVRPDTQLTIEGSEARIETRAGNRVAAGSAKVLRVEDNEKIYEGAIDLKLTEGIVLAKDEPAATRPWIAGVTGTIDSKRDWGAGPNLGYMGSRIGASVSLTFPNSVGSANVFARF
jgi:hypothetical protein